MIPGFSIDVPSGLHDLLVPLETIPFAPTIIIPPGPPVGTVLDGSLELTDVLGHGDDAIIYRAVDRKTQAKYAVKCLQHAQGERQKALHRREITLHRLASGHPGIVTIHKLVEDPAFIYIVMDYCPDGDLFTQILRRRTYLDYDALKHVFLQLLDAVEHCHNLGIFQ
jgi:serine/threonine protein kinase